MAPCDEGCRSHIFCAGTDVENWQDTVFRESVLQDVMETAIWKGALVQIYGPPSSWINIRPRKAIRASWTSFVQCTPMT